MNFTKTAITGIALSLVLFLIDSNSFASSDMPEKKITTTVDGGIDYLFDFMESEEKKQIEISKLENIIDLVGSSDKDSTTYSPRKWRRSTPIYQKFDIDINFKDLLKYIINPDIPPQAIKPSSLRYSYWKSVDEKQEGLPKLWQELKNLNKPILIRGTEHEMITPNANSGGYYAYDMERVLLLYKHKGRNVLVSISMQSEPSEVGEKGLVLGHPEDWNYFYSGIEGLTKKGLGWASSYIYRSFSISIYLEKKHGQPGINFGIFKWLRAGWMSMNMVEEDIMMEGIKRFAKDFKFVLENPKLPRPEILSKKFTAMKGLPLEELKKEAGKYIETLKKEYGSGEMLSRSEFAELINSEDYINNMNKEELISILVLEYMKKTLGKEFKGTLFLEKP